MTSSSSIVTRQYDELQKALYEKAKEPYKQATKEKKTINSKKRFAFFISAVGAFLLVIAFLISLFVIYIKRENIEEKTFKVTSLTLFGIMIVTLLAGAYLLSLYFIYNFRTKQDAFKQVDTLFTLPMIFNHFNLELKEDKNPIENCKKFILGLYDETSGIKITNHENILTFRDKDNENIWTVQEVELAENEAKTAQSLLFKCEFKNEDLNTSIYAGFQSEYSKKLIEKVNKEFVELSSEIDLFATNKLIKDDKINELKKFYKEFGLARNKYGFFYDANTKILHIWINTQNKLFDIEKVQDVASTLLNHAWLVAEIMNKTSSLI